MHLQIWWIWLFGFLYSVNLFLPHLVKINVEPNTGFPRGLESLEKPWILKNKFKAWNSLENGQVGLRAFKIIKWALKIFKSALKFSKILEFPAMFASAHSYQCRELCAHYRSSLYILQRRTVSEDEVNLLNTTAPGLVISGLENLLKSALKRIFSGS